VVIRWPSTDDLHLRPLSLWGNSESKTGQRNGSVCSISEAYRRLRPGQFGIRREDPFQLAGPRTKVSRSSQMGSIGAFAVNVSGKSLTP